MSDHTFIVAAGPTKVPTILPRRGGPARPADAHAAASSAPSVSGTEVAAQLLAREANHRIANSLQLLAVQLQQDRALMRDPVAAKVLDRAVDQVFAIAGVHRSLTRGTGRGGTDLRALLEVTATHLASLRPGIGISVEVDGTPLLLPHETERLALLAAELMMNAFKHAFREGEAGHIAIRCRSAADEVVLTVADDGIGPGPGPGSAGASSGGGAGREIIAGIAAALRASVAALATAGGGTTMQVTVPVSTRRVTRPASAH